MRDLAAWIAIGSLALVVYSYAVYPIVLAAWAAWQQVRRDLHYLRGKQERRQAEPADPSSWPAVAVVIAAYNEEQHIAARVANLLALDYPPEKLRILVGSDGSRDRTADILRGINDPRLHTHIVTANRGKAAMLNDLRERVVEDIAVFSDANTYFDAQALKRLVRWFECPEVGGVSGELRLLDSEGHNQDSLYWRIEQALKFFEGRVGGLLGANGAIYAIRRELWPALRPDTIVDDFCIGMAVPVAGRRLIYDPSAWAQEDTPDDLQEEYHRRLRIGVGNFQALFRHPEYLTQTAWATRFAYLSHKVIRWITPHLVLLALILSLLLAMDDPAWQAFAAAQVLAYGMTGALYWHSTRGGHVPRAMRLPAFFFALNWAFLRSSWRYARGGQAGSWRRTAR